MLPRLLKKSLDYVYRQIIGISLFGITTLCWAQEEVQENQELNIPLPGGGISGYSAQNMLVQFATSVPNLVRMLTALAYVMGMYFIIVGVIRLKHLGESRTMMSQEHSVKGPLIFLTVGALLLYFPTSVRVGMSTFWTNPNPYGYVEENVDQWSQFFNIIFMIVQLVGVIAFIRGLLTLSRLGGHGGQPDAFAKGLTYIIGGILCINIYQFVQVIMVTFGFQPY